jgi:predicted ATPase
VDERASGLFTVLGPAGVGKSRLATELCRELAADTTILTGRCLPYGEGITFWPLYELLDELGGERSQEVRARLASEVSSPEELFFSVRKLLEELARERPLVVVVEDIHWAESTLLDLLEYLVDWSRDAPFLLLCPARPELLDERTGWGGGRVTATTVLVESLPADAVARLIAALPGGPALPGPVVERILAAAEGNPLYVEEFLAMLVDDGLLRQDRDGTWRTAEGLADVDEAITIAEAVTLAVAEAVAIAVIEA